MMTEHSSTREATRTEVAEYLRTLADQLDTRGGCPLTDGLYSDAGDPPAAPGERGTPDRVTLVVGEDSVTVEPADEVGLRVGLRSSESRAGTEQSLSFELTWEVADGEGVDSPAA
jgi:hypothetical protein